MLVTLPPHPTDATLSVAKAARLLGVHANTIRAWSDAGRLRYYRINPRGDRRYRLSDLQRFLVAAKIGAPVGVPPVTSGAFGRRRVIEPAAVAGFTAVPRPIAHPRPDPLDAERHHLDLMVAATIARLTNTIEDVDEALQAVAMAVRDAYGHHMVVIWQARDDRFWPRAFAAAGGGTGRRPVDLPIHFGILGKAMDLAAGLATGPAAGHDRTSHLPMPGLLRGDDFGEAAVSIVAGSRPELVVVIPGPTEPWGVLHVVGERPGSLDQQDLDVAQVVADGLGAIIGVAHRADGVAHLLHRAEALQRIANDIDSRLDLDHILAGLVDHAMVLFEGDRAAVFMQQPDGHVVAEVVRGLSSGYIASVRDFPAASLPAEAVAARRPLFAVAYRDDPRGQGVRAAVVQEGFDTICTAPLLDGTVTLGLLNVYHDRPHHWSTDELDTMAALATHAGVAIRTAQDYARMVTWAAQLQSIQQLGARLNRLSSIAEIGRSIATELRQLIDYHNARVYRLVGDDLIPIAMLGQVGEYVDETPDQLRVALGEGITGWVALHRIAQNLGDAAADPRANTVPGTAEDLDESMLLAPMLIDDQVIGVLVLSKLGLHRFSDDDLRLLVIYASIAAQAMATADTTERLGLQTLQLEQQLRGQRELLLITESILTTLDARGVLESITDRIGGLLACDNIAIEVIDPTTGLLTSLTARGLDAAYHLEPWAPGETGVATWVMEHNEPVHIPEERSDPRVNHHRDQAGGEDGSLIVVPLRGRGGAIGVLTIERLGIANTFSAEEFELVQLFAAQVSIALQNAEVFQAVEIRARTDDLTGLFNHGTFQEWLEQSVREGGPFSLIMLDLDDFRDVNNELGHQAGDALLRQIAGELVRAGRESDLVFRYGGDEFTFLLPQTEAVGALHVAERARLAVKSGGGGVSASIGVATFPSDGTTATDILLAADRACFVAKGGGRDRIATAADGRAQAAELSLQAPTPVDSASLPAA